MFILLPVLPFETPQVHTHIPNRKVMRGGVGNLFRPDHFALGSGLVVLYTNDQEKTLQVLLCGVEVCCHGLVWSSHHGPMQQPASLRWAGPFITFISNPLPFVCQHTNNFSSTQAYPDAKKNQSDTALQTAAAGFYFFIYVMQRQSEQKQGRLDICRGHTFNFTASARCAGSSSNYSQYTCYTAAQPLGSTPHLYTLTLLMEQRIPTECIRAIDPIIRQH